MTATSFAPLTNFGDGNLPREMGWEDYGKIEIVAGMGGFSA